MYLGVCTNLTPKSTTKKNIVISYCVSGKWFIHFCYANRNLRGYTPCPKKTVQNFFCQNFVKCLSTLIIFGTRIAQRIGLCGVHSFPPQLI